MICTTDVLTPNPEVTLHFFNILNVKTRQNLILEVRKVFLKASLIFKLQK